MPTTSDNIEDPVELMLKKTGCIELHYKVQVILQRSASSWFLMQYCHLQECIAATQDWRQCHDAVQTFKSCMTAYTEAQRQKYKQ